jgi:serine/threonine protein kinase HipA of HipAB toxin-antitoxin module
VTFTPRLIAAETDAVAGRWCDLLVLEAVALGVVSSRGIPAARAHVVERPSHWFLESERFDRAGARGRLAVLSLAAVHDDPAHSWAQAAVELRNAGRLSDEDARRLRWLDAFGALIGNTDRHQFNVLVFPAGASLRLAPAFDQVSVLYAPSGDGRVPAGALALPRPSSDTLDVWDDARAAALDFWERASDDGRVSDDLRNVCSANARALLAGQGPSSG